MAELKPKKCKNCGEKFRPFQTLQKACSVACALSLSRKDAAKRERRALRERRQKLKTRADWLREAQAEFNRYIRLRDAGKPCISCGRFHSGKYDAGHYRSVGACSALRFDEANCHRQCVPCNQHKSGNIVEYRINLIRRIGAEEVERLETTNPLRAWTVEEAKAIKAHYREACKALERGELVPVWTVDFEPIEGVSK
ncbi:recombination protein NinG [Microbulbifer thermotolerans]|uniref:recombination protein NinG n=1 Tax=Microbulbifer thermotolerans TaxID=252514 RepID=UPI00224B15B5|nr:recombination protein NinG [Microbulbifer thermotolerans]MCX2780409.1 recombination protein NinG [Microbulbifer thermotolerans]MCX2805919.1 recombination protein NinG [Microbulbifer thermotolerans]